MYIGARIQSCPYDAQRQQQLREISLTSFIVHIFDSIYSFQWFFSYSVIQTEVAEGDAGILFV